MPNNLTNNNYLIKLKKNEVILEFDNKKGKSNIIPINLVNSENQSIEEIKLYPDNTYLIKKLLINNNKTSQNNQSSIQIIKIE